MRVTAQAPGRLDVLGGVADYSGSLVLEIPTEASTTVSVTFGDDGPAGDFVTLTSSSVPESPSQVSLEPLRSAVIAGTYSSLSLPAVAEFLKTSGAPSWVRYVYGSLASFVKAVGWLPSSGGLHFDVSSTVPIAQGVSSSASLEVATLRALREASGLDIPSMDLAFMALSAEHEVAGAPCGMMDQLSVTFGSPREVLPIVCRPNLIQRSIPIPSHISVIGWPSGVKHAVSGSPYQTARTATFMAKKMAESALQRPLDHLTQLPPSTLIGLVAPTIPSTTTGKEYLDTWKSVDDPLSPIDPSTLYPVGACARFPIEENWRCTLGLSLVQAMQGTEDKERLHELLCQFGELMLQSHEGYTSIGLGCPTTDEMVRRIMSPEFGPEKGFYGARVSGGGSGGTVVVLCASSAVPLLASLAASMTSTTLIQ